jgi:hypothetical protein
LGAGWPSVATRGLLLVCLGVFCAPSVRAESTNAAPAAIAPAPVLVKSEFNAEPSAGKDPFFPKSSRRAVVARPNSDIEPVAPVGHLVVKGVTLSRTQRTAIINDLTFAEDEERLLRVNDHSLKVRCQEVREHSVRVTVNGMPCELPFNQTRKK